MVLLAKSPNCFDKEQNGGEVGVDCGGSCSLQCRGSYREPKVSFVRAMPVGENKYDVFALLENYNTGIYFPNIPYEISVYNSNAERLMSASGTTRLMQNARGVIYIPNVSSKQYPKVTDIQLGEAQAFTQQETKIQQSVKTSAWAAKRIAGNNLQVIAKIQNTSVNNLADMDVYALLYDDTKTVYATGKTYVAQLLGREESAVVFTWGNLPSPANVDFIVVEK